MIRTIVSLTVLFVLAVVPSTAQELTAEQQEVWEFELDCLRLVGNADARDAWLDCFHEDYVGWWTEDPAPGNKNSVRTQVANESWTHSKFLSAWPMSITRHGDVAVVHYVSQWNEMNSEGKWVSVWNHWTDIAMKSGGRWQWIADSGGYAGHRPD